MARVFPAFAPGNVSAVNPASAAALKTALVGVDLPAEKTELLEYAVRQRAEPPFLDALRALPDREYESLDEVVEELVHVQPPRVREDAGEPHDESGVPPGGDDYTRADPPDAGQVRE
jgi:hypothetical protein